MNGKDTARNNSNGKALRCTVTIILSLKNTLGLDEKIVSL